MLVFAKFVMRDSGLPIHISTPHVTQVRLTIDGEPAIYLAGKETPILVEGTLEGALKNLEAAAAGLRLVEPEAEAPPATATVTVFPVAEPPAPIARIEPPAPAAAVEVEAAAPEPAVEVEAATPAPAPKVKAAKPKKPAAAPAVKAKASKPAPEDAKPVAEALKPAPAAKPAKAAPSLFEKPAEKDHSPMSWFKGLR